ncbi:MAG: hypothetical protein P8P77_04630, partial [Crocinitomicaceae bacterium]|nr:hypothetical protein [Crocinitomicaceae bacterium]
YFKKRGNSIFHNYFSTVANLMVLLLRNKVKHRFSLKKSKIDDNGDSLYFVLSMSILIFDF